MTVISMSHTELHRLTVILDLVEARITAPQAATLLHLTERQVWRCGDGSCRRGRKVWSPASAVGSATGVSIPPSR